MQVPLIQLQCGQCLYGPTGGKSQLTHDQASIAMTGVRSRLLELPETCTGLILCVGKVGKESAAAKYAAATETNKFSIEDEKPYAEVRGKLQAVNIHDSHNISYGWVHIHLYPPRMSKPSDLCSILSKTTRLLCLLRSATYSARNFRSYSKFYQSARP